MKKGAMMLFNLKSEYQPSGDQPEAINALVANLRNGKRFQTLLGVTGSGKTFTLANVIAQFGRPVLVLSHNKTLAAQLYSEFKSFFPSNAMEYFISYYDYYLPESYIPQTDTYIAKDASINENIERLRLSATASLVERKDVLIVASVSCIYGLTSPADYEEMCVTLKTGMTMDRNELLRLLVAIQFERNDAAPERGEFRVRGDRVDIFLPQKEEFVRVEFWGDSIESLSRCELVTGKIKSKHEKVLIFPAKHFVMPQERIEAAISGIVDEMKSRVKEFEREGKLVEAQRLYQRVNYDMEMLREIGYCSGIENYSRHLSNRPPGSRPYCLLDFYSKDFITVIDESHVTIPQLQAMYKADRSRKQTLVDHGFRLPSAMDNRPLMFNELMGLLGDIIFVSATPGKFELELSQGSIVEQVVRPTGLLDPLVEVRKLDGQVDDVIEEIRRCSAKGGRSLIATLTKKSAERLSDYLADLGIRVKYIHSEIDAIERVRILSELRRGDFDCIVGINLLREGIDLPEIMLVAILDADKEGFLRSSRSLIQVAGRAARNVDGKVILYADNMTDSMKSLIETTEARRRRQSAYNDEHGITPVTIVKAARESITDVLGLAPTTKTSTYDIVESGEELLMAVREEAASYGAKPKKQRAPVKGKAVRTSSAMLEGLDIGEVITELEREMLEAAENLEFERAAALRDKIKSLTPSPITKKI